MRASTSLASASTSPALGVLCFAGDLETATRLVVQRGASGQGGYACFGNAHVLVSALHDPEVRRALDRAWKVFPDGASVAWLQRRLGSLVAERVAGPDLMSRVCAEGNALGIRHFLLGSTNDVLARLRKNLEKDHPGIAIAGSYSPTRNELEIEIRALVERVASCDSQIVWCAFGAPRQELWMAEAAPELPSGLFIGVGAAFDFIAETKPRAPVWIQRAGFEWAHRLATEPRRLTGRYLRTNSEFVLRASAEILRGGRR